MNKPKPTEAELEILQILWKHGASTVGFVNEQLNEKREVGYTTTLKTMQLMSQKGILNRDTSKRKHVYQPLISEEATQKGIVDRLLETTFGGSAMKLVMQALGNRKTSKEELEKIKSLIDQIEKGGKS
ncbi:MAG: BlaI/MecI/CopY family transcriptional regulator [Bacteroidota bacterium]